MQGRLTELTSRLEGLEIDVKKFTATMQQVMPNLLLTIFRLKFYLQQVHE